MADHNALPLVILAEKFASLPGIGMKSAQRLAYHVMSMDEASVEDFANALISAKKNVRAMRIITKYKSIHQKVFRITAKTRSFGDRIAI